MDWDQQSIVLVWCAQFSCAAFKSAPVHIVSYDNFNVSNLGFSYMIQLILYLKSLYITAYIRIQLTCTILYDHCRPDNRVRLDMHRDKLSWSEETTASSLWNQLPHISRSNPVSDWHSSSESLDACMELPFHLQYSFEIFYPSSIWRITPPEVHCWVCSKVT